MLNRAQVTKLAGQTVEYIEDDLHAECKEDILMEGGCTKNRRAMPPIEKPMSWVDIVSIHWSKGCFSLMFKNVFYAHTAKIIILVVEHSLDGNDIGSVSTT